MKKSIFTTISALTFAGLCFPLLAGEEQGMPKVSMPKEFALLKNLVGTWEGKTDMGNGEKTMEVKYHLTAGGSAVTETLMAGQPGEMESVYYKQGDSLGMTHYCVLGNHPQMNLKKADKKSLEFEMEGVKGIQSGMEPHMHSVKLTMVDSNTLKQDWVHFIDGKSTQTVTFLLHRKMVE